jgi:PPOX class probable F420-dependent enzyme
LDEQTCRERFAAARVARLATAGADGRPHVVPVTFDSDGSTVVTAVDHKPKRTWDLRRLRNIAQNPAVAFLVDAYDEDWRALWWVRADARACVVTEGAEHEAAVARLVARYPQYADVPPRGPVVIAEVERWSGWSAAGSGSV